VTPDAVGEWLAARTRELCAIPSVTGGEAAVADAVEALARSRGLACDRAGNTLVVESPADARPSVGLFGHLDTVPPHPDDGAARVEGARVYGRGASDMKGGVAVMEALAAEDSSGWPVRPVFVYYDREEGPYRDNGLEALFARRGDLAGLAFGICLEPTDLRVEAGCCGSVHATLHFDGRQAHSARPWQGENAIHKAAPVLSALAARGTAEVEHRGLRFVEAMSATVAQGGSARNVIPDFFRVNVNFRFAPGRSLDQACDEFRSIAGSLARVEFTDLAPAGEVASGPWLDALLTATGAAIEAKQAWTDVARLGARGVPAVNFGPGEGAQAHRPGESVPVRNLETAWRVLSRFLRTGCASD